MSKRGERTIEAVIIPANGTAEPIISRALSSCGKNFRVHTVNSPSDAITPSVIFIDTASLPKVSLDLTEVLLGLKRSKWWDVPVIILDDPNADIMRGFAAGYDARVRLDAEPKEIARLVERVLAKRVA
jgi:hypothetical protein